MKRARIPRAKKRKGTELPGELGRRVNEKSLRGIIGSAGGPGPSREETRRRGKTVKCTVVNCKVYTVIQ
jgi:hypothetical protein